MASKKEYNAWNSIRNSSRIWFWSKTNWEFSYRRCRRFPSGKRMYGLGNGY
ncbi:215R [Invertebrate iridescent virus 6]|uniref:215R n=1 Tax=Invertebrate iridescent virus 6 TaxID=176652 RepID=Q91FV6_IIV6|nr:215R [Invertebrate iridescent virus 6]AAK82077.1 215R [Invertebrate iridescent virus 6]